MKDYYESLWSSLPPKLTIPEYDRRARFLTSEIRPGERMLDLGCGAGAFSAFAATAGAEVLGLDVAQAAIDRATTAHPSLSFGLTEFDGPLKLPDNSFEIVWASEVIEHVADTATWLSEIRRVLVPGGRLLLTTPAHDRLTLLLGGIERFSPPLGDHLHLYSARSLRTLLSEFDFGDLRIWAARWPPALPRTLFARAVR